MVPGIVLAMLLVAASGEPATPAGREPPRAPPPDTRAVPLPPPPASGRFTVPSGRTGKVLRIGVPEPNVVGRASPREVAVVSQALVTEVRKLEGVGAVGVAEIREMLAQEYRRQMLGCAVDQQCLAEVAGALGVDELLSSELVVSGGTSTFSVSRIDMRSTRVLASVQKRLARRRAGEEVLGAVGEVVATLYRDRALKAGETRGVAPQAARWLNPPPLPRWVFFTTLGAAALASGGGAIYGLASNSTRGEFNALARGGGTVSGAELVRLQARADEQQTRAIALFGVAGAFAIAAGVEAFFTDWHDDRAAIRVGPGGATLTVRF